MKKLLLVIVVIMIGNQVSQGQISAYGSATYGFSSNPLYNYQKYSDRLVQTYVEVNSDRNLENGQFKLQYVGGSMIFDRFALRNYYEHRLSAATAINVANESEQRQSEGGEEAKQEEEGEEEEESEERIQDSTGVFVLTNLQITARHDKKEYREFNNYGIILNNGAYFCGENEFTLRLLSKTEYRNYPNLLRYNNLSEIVSLYVENGTASDQRYGIYVNTGLKYFTNMVYDTSLFEETRSYVVRMMPDSQLVGSGKQKYWEYFSYPDTSESDKVVIKDPGTKSTYQLALGMFYQWQWEDLLLRMDLGYRFNSRSTLLTLVQNTSTLTLNEDLYNSVFNAHGPEVHCVIKYIFPYNIQWIMNIEVENKIFETPSYDMITGEISHEYRKDTRFNCDLFISRYFNLTEGFGADIAFSSNILRNQSNDAYNDYSVINYSFSIGVSL